MQLKESAEWLFNGVNLHSFGIWSYLGTELLTKFRDYKGKSEIGPMRWPTAEHAGRTAGIGRKYLMPSVLALGELGCIDSLTSLVKKWNTIA